MSLRSLPVIDVPLHQRDPRDCRKCGHSYYDGDDTERRYARCVRTGKMCVFERDTEGQCGPEARGWVERV